MNGIGIENQQKLDAVYEKYFDMLFRICRMYFPHNAADAEDAVASVFIRYMENTPVHENEEHEKAWFITAARNVCINMKCRLWRRDVSIDDENTKLPIQEMHTDELLELVLSLPEKQKMCIYLFYYEGMSCSEIGDVLGISENSVYGNLNKGRKKLKSLIELV